VYGRSRGAVHGQLQSTTMELKQKGRRAQLRIETQLIQIVITSSTTPLVLMEKHTVRVRFNSRFRPSAIALRFKTRRHMKDSDLAYMALRSTVAYLAAVPVAGIYFIVMAILDHPRSSTPVLIPINAQTFAAFTLIFFTVYRRCLFVSAPLFLVLHVLAARYQIRTLFFHVPAWGLLVFLGAENFSWAPISSIKTVSMVSEQSAPSLTESAS
jgi:hypothetical protein